MSQAYSQREQAERYELEREERKRREEKLDAPRKTREVAAKLARRATSKEKIDSLSEGERLKWKRRIKDYLVMAKQGPLTRYVENFPEFIGEDDNDRDEIEEWLAEMGKVPR